MSEETPTYNNMHAPATTPDGDGLLPRRNGSRGLLPSTWIGRTLRIEYTGADGKRAEGSGVLLDWCPVGVILSLAGAKTLIPWERLALLELVEEPAGGGG